MALGLVSSLFLSAPYAHAADTATNVELAKKVIKEVAPIVAEVTKSDDQDNQKPAAKDYIEKPLVVETKITPKTKPIVKSTSNSVILAVSNNEQASAGGRTFPFGYCTYWVAKKRVVPWSGNAITWLAGAKSYGFPTGDTPAVGAIMVTSEGGRAGHVAYIEAVEGDQVTVSEMNYKGFGVVSTRTLSTKSAFIKGYIY